VRKCFPPPLSTSSSPNGIDRTLSQFPFHGAIPSSYHPPQSSRFHKVKNREKSSGIEKVRGGGQALNHRMAEVREPVERP